MAARDQAAGQEHVDGDQGDRGRYEAGAEHARPHVTVDHRLTQTARLARHHIVGDGVYAHCQRGPRIGDQVDPEDLRGQQGQHDGTRCAAGVHAGRPPSHVGSMPFSVERNDVIRRPQRR